MINDILRKDLIVNHWTWHFIQINDQQLINEIENQTILSLSLVYLSFLLYEDFHRKRLIIKLLWERISFVREKKKKGECVFEMNRKTCFSEYDQRKSE